MTTYRDLTSELNSGAVVARQSWSEDECVFMVDGNLLAPSFYDHYGVGYDKLPIQNVLAFSNGVSVELGWSPSIEDQEATDWFVEENTACGEVESAEAVAA
jgi:hypothetical protein